VRSDGLLLVDGQCTQSFLATTGAFASPAVRVMSVLKGACSVARVMVKVLFVVVAVPLILLFAIASFGAIFAGLHW
jgi:K+ transporter